MKFLRYHQIKTLKLYRISIYLTFVGGRGERFEGYAVTQRHKVLYVVLIVMGTDSGYGCLFSRQFFCYIPDGLVIHASNS